ncbi:MAG TPA: protein translocase subunit SecF [Acidimicrobiales bacterium]|nr:protein translocase subunit SecF [Acidimicrobiales bacterium]
MSENERTGRPSLRHRLYHGETAFDFVGRRRIWFALSGLVIAVGVISLLTQGLNYGIEFRGGISWQLPARGVSVAEARDALRPLGLADAKIQTADDGTLRVQAGHQSPEDQARVTERLAELAKLDVGQVSVNDVGPSWGKAVTDKARTALIVFFVIIAIYISLRFEWKMAVAALSAVVHDIFVTVGVYSLSRFEVTPATVVAFLTILGYSLYDTVVVFDKVQENAKAMSASGRTTYSGIVNLSMNQVLMRSLNTSLVAILPILSVLLIGSVVLGATSLKDFGLALLVGLLTGAYSSIYIASPILAMLKEREARYRAIRQKVSSRGGTGILTPAAAAASLGAADDDGEDATERRTAARQPTGAKTKARVGAGDDRVVSGPRPGGGSRPHSGQRPPPRPRKKGKKR